MITPEEKVSSPQPQEYEEIVVHPSYPEQTVKIEQSFSKDELEQLKEFLLRQKDNFAGALGYAWNQFESHEAQVKY